MKVLIIEDDSFIGNHIFQSLSRRGFSVRWEKSLESGLEEALLEEFDCIILDRRLPGGDGLNICKEIRNQGINAPIIILSALGDTEQKVEGLNSGADDYLTKPFSIDELVARIHAVIRRETMHKSPTLEINGITLNSINRTVIIQNQKINLSNLEFSILHYLMHHADEALTREQIFNHVWENGFDPESNVVDVYINYLRNKIDLDKNEPSKIETLRGFGYRFIKNE